MLSDVIITDFVLPILDGFEITRRLREIPQLKNIVIIASSASFLREDQSNSLEGGCDDFLPKPIAVEKLLVPLQKYLQLEWVYEDLPYNEIEENAELIPPPEDILLKIYEAAKIDHIEVIEQNLERVQEQY